MKNKQDKKNSRGNIKKTKKHNKDVLSNHTDNTQHQYDAAIYNIELGEEMLTRTSTQNMKKSLPLKDEQPHYTHVGLHMDIADEIIERQGSSNEH